MKIFKRISLMRFIFILLGGFCAWVQPLAAEDTENTRATLKGLPGIHVSIVTNPLVEDLGPTQNQLQTDVELKLRKAGIKVYTAEQGRLRPGRPVLEVAVSFLCADKQCTHSILVSVLQAVVLERDASIRNNMAVTWSTGSTGFVNYQNSYATIRNLTKDHVDEFINAYLSVKPGGTI